MAKDASFDVVSRVDMQEVVNAVDQTMREVTNRYDFKGTNARADLDQKAGTVTMVAPSEMTLESLKQILTERMVKRGIDIRAVKFDNQQAAGGNNLRQKASLTQGIEALLAKKITGLIRDSKIKVKAEIQGDLIRVSGKSKDDLQSVIALLKGQELEVPLQFVNYR
jgi:uncharacterized protein YajQ (UPF0234 family)